MYLDMMCDVSSYEKCIDLDILLLIEFYKFLDSPIQPSNLLLNKINFNYYD